MNANLNKSKYSSNDGPLHTCDNGVMDVKMCFRIRQIKEGKRRVITIQEVSCTNHVVPWEGVTIHCVSRERYGDR